MWKGRTDHANLSQSRTHHSACWACTGAGISAEIRRAGIRAFIALIGKTTEQTILFLALIWLSKKEMSDPTASKMLKVMRSKTVAQLLRDARKAVQESPTD